MNVGRLFRMGLPEVVDRSRQELWKGFERIGLAEITPASPLGVFAELAPRPDLEPIRARAQSGDRTGAANALFERFRASVPQRFFAGASRAVTPGLLDARMTADDRLLATADAICGGRFDFLGYRRLSYGDPVDWHLDPVSRRRAPLVHWSRIDPLDAQVVGDAKVIWELSRHQWLVRLGQAYMLTRDERYADTFGARVREWLGANPPGFGINWVSSLELALRVIAWSWALVLFRGSRTLSAELFAAMLESAVAHATHVERYLSHYYSPNTHLTGEALGLFYAGVVFSDLRAAPRWRALGHRILVQESARQVLSDGVHFERATCYQRYTAEIYLHFCLLAARNGLAVPTAVVERLESLLDFLLAVRRPDGSMPQIGDADGGWLLPLAARSPDDLRGVFATAAALLRRPEHAWAAGGAAPEPLWLIGSPEPEVPAPRAPAHPASRVFPDGGYVVLRSGWDRRAHQMILDAGALGCPASAGHGHADLLSIQCAAFGEPYIVDPGTYCYTADPAWRDFFRGTSAHSTVVVDGIGQAVPRGPFAWESRPEARLVQWRSTATLEVAEGEHDAYARLPEPVRHRRRVLWVKPRYWVVVDDLSGSGEHAIELRFQFAPMEVTVTPTLWARARGARGHGLLIRPFATARLKADVLLGEPGPIQGWVSPDYGLRRPAPALVYSTTTRVPMRIATLLLPIEDPSAEPPPVSLLLGEGPGPVALCLEDRGETVRFGAREQLRVGSREPGTPGS